MTRQTETKRTYTVDEAAELLGVSRSTAYDAINRGEIPVIRVGRRMLIPKVKLDALLSGNDPA